MPKIIGRLRFQIYFHNYSLYFLSGDNSDHDYYRPVRGGLTHRHFVDNSKQMVRACYRVARKALCELTGITIKSFRDDPVRQYNDWADILSTVILENGSNQRWMRLVDNLKEKIRDLVPINGLETTRVNPRSNATFIDVLALGVVRTCLGFVARNHLAIKPYLAMGKSSGNDLGQVVSTRNMGSDIEDLYNDKDSIYFRLNSYANLGNGNHFDDFVNNAETNLFHRAGVGFIHLKYDMIKRGRLSQANWTCIHEMAHYMYSVGDAYYINILKKKKKKNNDFAELRASTLDERIATDSKVIINSLSGMSLLMSADLITYVIFIATGLEEPYSIGAEYRRRDDPLLQRKLGKPISPGN